SVLARLAEDRSRTLVLVEHRITEALPLVDRVVVIEAGGGVIADGTPSKVFAGERARLDALGVWVPGSPPSAVAHPRDGAGRVLAALLERLHLSHLAAANPFTLSGGEQRRLSVATALATAPPLLVLDEPTFGQDRRTYRELAELLAMHRASAGGVLFATHD